MSDKQQDTQSLTRQQETSPAPKLTIQDVADQSPIFSEILKVYPDLAKKSVSITQEQLDRILEYASDSTLRLAKSVALNCRGANCPYASMCIYYQTGLAQQNEPCMEEVVMIQQTLPQLIKDFQIELEDRVEHDMVQEYMDAMVQEHRARKDIALIGQTVERVTAVDETTGQPYTEEVENPVLAVKERAQARKDKIRRDMVKTREGRLKYKVSNPEDESTKAADIRERVEQSKKRHTQPESQEGADSDDVQDAEFEDITDNAEDKQ